MDSEQWVDSLIFSQVIRKSDIMPDCKIALCFFMGFFAMRCLDPCKIDVTKDTGRFVEEVTNIATGGGEVQEA